jgi:predicted DNA-binding transcriptional regulator YafY
LDAALSFRPFAPEDIQLETFQALTRATQQQRVVGFTYRALAAEKAAGRKVQPYHVACVDNCWYLLAHDLGRGAMRTFALSRMREVEVLPEPFTRPKEFDANDYLKGSFGIFKGGDDFEVVIQFDRWAADLVRERRWHWSQELIDLPKGGGIRLRMRLNNLTEVERWVLSWGTHATVIRPKKLATRLRDITKELAERYENPPEA